MPRRSSRTTPRCPATARPRRTSGRGSASRSGGASQRGPAPVYSLKSKESAVMRRRAGGREGPRPPRLRREVDARALEGELRRRIRGEVRFDDGSRALYATDGSNYRQVPIGVVVPRTAQDVVEAVAAAREVGAPITMRGGGTSLAGQS